MHQTELDLDIVLTHTENLSTSEQSKVTVAYQEMIQHSSRYLGQHTSTIQLTIQDLLTITGQSLKEEE